MQTLLAILCSHDICSPRISQGSILEIYPYLLTLQPVHEDPRRTSLAPLSSIIWQLIIPGLIHPSIGITEFAGRTIIRLPCPAFITRIQLCAAMYQNPWSSSNATDPHIPAVSGPC